MRHTVLLFVFLASACSPAPDGNTATPAIPATTSSTLSEAIVSAANPHAVRAAVEMLEKGGHAVDAAIAAHAVLSLVEPQSSGVGGGAFMLMYDAGSGQLSAFDGRETAPAGATEDMFMIDGELMGYIDAWQSGVAVGVPGAVALYELAHREYGKLTWAELFEPAIRLATDGFEVSPRMANMLPMIGARGRLDEYPGSAEYFFPGGEPLPIGYLRKNPEYAHTLSRIAAEGSQAFYSGEIAEQIAAAAQAEPHGGTLSVEDIGKYEAIKRDAVCGGFRDMAICVPPPPSSGIAQIMIAGLYDHLSAATTTRSEKIQAFVDAQRLGYADRDHFVGDPAFADVPVDALIHPDYIRHRATERFVPGATPTPGDPIGVLGLDLAASNRGRDTTDEIGGTTHLSIIDAYGNAVSMTATVEAPFGSSRWVGGFLLNNQLTDFARRPSTDGTIIANAIAPGKRPRSSMTPSMVFDGDNKLFLVTGSVGGNSIIAYVAKTIVGILDWELTAQEAADFPNIVARGKTVRVEIAEDPGSAIAATLADQGYDVQEREGENSGTHLIIVHPDRMEGAADKRREGIVRSVLPSESRKN